MKLRKRIVVILLSMIVAFVALPSQSYAAESLSDDNNEFYLGTDYNLTLKAGSSVSLFEWTGVDDLDSPDDAVIDSLESSDEDVATVEDKGDGEIEIKGVSAGSTTIIVSGRVTHDDDTDLYEDGAGEYETTYIKVKVTSGNLKSTIKSKNWIFKNSTKVKVVATNVRKGDIIRLKIGKKTYTKKITGTKSKLTTTIKIKKPGFYGKKYTLSLRRKDKTVASSKKYVYLSDTVYVGYTKKKVKWLVYWKDPDKKNLSAYSEQWCYDWDGDGYHDAYLYFRNGKVTNWQIYE